MIAVGQERVVDDLADEREDSLSPIPESWPGSSG